MRLFGVHVTVTHGACGKLKKLFKFEPILQKHLIRNSEMGKSNMLIQHSNVHTFRERIDPYGASGKNPKYSKCDYV